MKSVYIVLCVFVATISTLIMFTFDATLGIVQTCIFLVLGIIALIMFLVYDKQIRTTIKRAAKYFEQLGIVESFPMPTLICTEKGEIIWYNSFFENEVITKKTSDKRKISEFVGDVSLSAICTTERGVNIKYIDRYYTVCGEPINTDYCLFFIDNTELKIIAEEYKNTRPVVVQMKIDNLEEVYRNYKNSECEVISGELEHILESWASTFPNVFRRIGSGKYLMVIDEKSFESIVDSKFEILKKIKDYKYGNKPIEITLSIGIGRGGSITQCDEFSKEALAMSQSRGGYQATVNTNGHLEFYGGTVSGTTSRTKIKPRVIASAFADHVTASDAVFVMGHCFSDLDSVGSAMGVYSIVKAFGKDCYVIVDKEKSMAKNLIEQLLETPLKSAFIDSEKAYDFITAKSLLVVVDTHRVESLDYPEIFPAFEKVIVIDHHRRTANYINNAILFYDEPNASSTSEMVTEMIQYMPVKVDVHPMIAEALLSGIMLDTRNFVVSTGARTFEAAAHLKELGADTVAAKQLFANDEENYKLKNEIISTAVVYKECAVAVATKHSPELRIVASQVANELLNVTGVKSSYVLFEENGQINISARSLGDVNVQIIMEKLGGGGHLTMAATQLSNMTMGDAVIKLENAINSYLEEAN